MFILFFLLFLPAWWWKCVCVKSLFVRSRREQQEHLPSNARCDSISFVQLRPLFIAAHTTFFFLFFDHKDTIFWHTSSFSRLRIFLSSLRQQRKNIQNERKADGLLAPFYFLWYVFFCCCCLWYICLRS